MSVKVTTSKKHGEVEYRFFYRMQQQLQSYQTKDPGLLDFWLQAVYSEMAEATRDAYAPDGWAIAVLSDSVDQVVPVRRGGYFRLPFSQAAFQEDGVILFREPNREHKLFIQWSPRIDADQRIAYGTLVKALQELRTVQDRVPTGEKALSKFKRARYDAIKACFRDAGGHIFVNGSLRAQARVGRCQVLRLDPGRADSTEQVEFVGAFDIATFVSLRDYL